MMCRRSYPDRVASRRPQRLAALLAGAFGCGAALANPTGPQIINGQVSIIGSGNQLSITNSPGAIINWQSFSIGAGELTRFIQQSSSSTVLNRVTGQNPSQIFGALQSNGKVFLINPNGMLFGPGAQVNVNGLVASSLNLTNADFLAGKFNFSGTGALGDVTNRGAITTPSGGQVYLIAPSVGNSGIITAPGGDVMLAAGQSVDLADSSDPAMRVVISAPGNQALNVGSVVADSGRIGIYGALVNQLGFVSADSAVAGANGKIVFKSSGDTTLGAASVTSAAGAGTGGEIEVLGNRVALTGDATVDASGRTGGGSVLIGGDTHGSNPTVQNAALTYVGPMARIMADAENAGDGGKIVVWSEQQTQMYGDISARGGAQGGNGGSVEASSAGILDFEGQADLRAPHGWTGNLLLDPTDITIATGPSSGINLPGSAPFTITGSNPTSILSVTDLESELGLGNVIVSTSSSASAVGTISVASPVSWSNSNTLTLAADQSVHINAPIIAATGTLVLTAAGGNITQAIDVSAPATISVAALAASAPNGSVSLSEPSNSVSGAIAGVGGQGFSFSSTAAVTVGTVASISGVQATTGNIGLQAGAGITLNAPVTVSTANGVVALQATGGDIVQASSGAPITAASVSAVAANGSVGLNDASNAVGTIAGSANGSSGFSLADGNSFTVGSVPAVGNIPAAGGIASSGALGFGVVLETPGVGDITLDAPIDGGSGSVLVSAAGAVLQGVGGLVTAGSLYLDSGDATGIGSSTAPLLGNVGNLYNVNSQGPIYFSNSGSLTIAGITAVGAINVNSGGTLTVAGTGTCGDCYFAITGSSITLTAYGAMLLDTGSLVTAGGPVALHAGYDAASGTYVGSPNTLTLNGSLTGSSVALFAGGAISIAGSVTGTLTQAPSLYSSAPPPPPTLAQCETNPSIAGCSSVLPTLAQCTAVSTTAGCNVVLPTVAHCSASPATAGCNVVLPTLAQCSASPATAGCSVVLPTVAQCSVTPAMAGCNVVLPTLAQCQTTPALTGCEAVLPTVAQCAASPALPGCTTVLPPVANSAPVTASVVTAASTVIDDINVDVTVVSTAGTAQGDDSSGNATNTKPTSSSSGATTDTGATNSAAAKKMYCN
ncbi:MAG TPA: filamentous hemagglutinin N-terminal domain-containing protein [Steroidobacteraceae bacterium]|nr:filamentous hemagglutinin N-terminal domain-containing protein [Steroidobacteraceae bacterium]